MPQRLALYRTASLTAFILLAVLLGTRQWRHLQGQAGDEQGFCCVRDRQPCVQMGIEECDQMSGLGFTADQPSCARLCGTQASSSRASSTPNSPRSSQRSSQSSAISQRSSTQSACPATLPIVAHLPTPRITSCAEDTSTSRIYCFGGHDSSGNLRNDIVQFDPATNAIVTKKTKLPKALASMSCAENSATHMIYCLGGGDPKVVGTSADIVEYNPETDAIRSMGAKLPSGRYALSCAENSQTNMIYCFGGTIGGGINTSQIVEYDPALDRLRIKRATAPKHIRGLACAENQATNTIYCFGGDEDDPSHPTGFFSRQILEYNPQTDIVLVRKKLPASVSFMSCAQDAESQDFYCFGGVTHTGDVYPEPYTGIAGPGYTFYDRILRYNPTTEDIVTVDATFVPGRLIHNACAYHSPTRCIYCFGGDKHSGRNVTDEVVRFCPTECASSSGASSSTLPTLSICGNGKRDQEEDCDDGNEKDDDGCSSWCAVENGWQCTYQDCSSKDSRIACVRKELGNAFPAAPAIEKNGTMGTNIFYWDGSTTHKKMLDAAKQCSLETLHFANFDASSLISAVRRTTSDYRSLLLEEACTKENYEKYGTKYPLTNDLSCTPPEDLAYKVHGGGEGIIPSEGIGDGADRPAFICQNKDVCTKIQTSSSRISSSSASSTSSQRESEPSSASTSSSQASAGLPSSSSTQQSAISRSSLTLLSSAASSTQKLPACGDNRVDAGEECGEPGLACNRNQTCNYNTCKCIQGDGSDGGTTGTFGWTGTTGTLGTTGTFTTTGTAGTLWMGTTGTLGTTGRGIPGTTGPYQFISPDGTVSTLLPTITPEGTLGYMFQTPGAGGGTSLLTPLMLPNGAPGYLWTLPNGTSTYFNSSPSPIPGAYQFQNPTGGVSYLTPAATPPSPSSYQFISPNGSAAILLPTITPEGVPGYMFQTPDAGGGTSLLTSMVLPDGDIDTILRAPDGSLTTLRRSSPTTQESFTFRSPTGSSVSLRPIIPPSSLHASAPEEGICGDNIVQLLLDEQCEPSLHDPALPFACQNCRFFSPFCGDGQMDPGEECDDGLGNMDQPNIRCRSDCGFARCGDGILDSLLEQCDFRDPTSSSRCNRSCRLELPPTSLSPFALLPPSQLLGSSFPVQDLEQQVVEGPAFLSTSYLPPTTYHLPPRQPQQPVTGPEILAIMAAGAAGGLAWIRRKH